MRDKKNPMEFITSFALCILAIVLGIIALTVFFTLWRVLEKKLHPEKMVKPENTPEVAFRALRKKLVDVHMKNGDVLRDHKYMKTLLFGDGEFATCTVVYFQVETPDGNQVFISGNDIVKIEARKLA